MVDIVGNRTLKSKWNETVKYYSNTNFLEYISVNNTVRKFTYKEFDKLVHKTANWFLELGIKQNELVALHFHNSPEYLICWLALAQIGAVSVPLNEHYCIPEIDFILHRCEVKSLICEDRFLKLYIENRESLGIENLIVANKKINYPNVLNFKENIENQPYPLSENRTVNSENMAVILFTSGTTQHPKGAIYTHCNVLYGGLLHASQISMTQGERFLSSMPCYHMDFQEMAVMPVICTGSTLIMIEHYSAHRFWKQVYEYRATYTDTMSMMNRTMLLQPAQPWEKDHCLKQIYFSMGLSNEEKDAFEHRFRVNLLNSYGMTETVSAVTCSPLTGDKNWPSVGRPALSYGIKIVDCEGNTLPDGKIGEICVWGIKGKSLVLGYYKDEVATAKLFDSEGWLHSGDRGYLDKDGWLFFVDRWVNMIKRSGENVSSLEVECVLSSHPKILEAAVIGVPDSIRGQCVKAFVKLEQNSELSTEDLEEYCIERLAKFKVPTIWEFVIDFPCTSTGKIKKQLLV